MCDGDFYCRLAEKSGFDPRLVNKALAFCENLPAEKLWNMFTGDGKKGKIPYFKGGFYPDEFYAAATKLFWLKKTPCESGFLYLYIAFAEKSLRIYEQNRLDEKVFFDSFKRLAEGAAEFFADRGFYGLYDYRFAAGHVRGSVVRLEGLEYCYGEYKNKKAIFLHVPNDADISRENRLKSYEKAYRRFGKYKVVLDSWLLYPENISMLSENSRISDFAKDFDIVSVDESFDYDELFHVFGRRSGKIEPENKNLPNETSLQKGYIRRMSMKKPCGSAVGVLKETVTIKKMRVDK